MWVTAPYDVFMLYRSNKELAEDLTKRSEDLRDRAQHLEEKYAKSLNKHFTTELAPFAVAFGKIKNCSLDDPDLVGRIPAMQTLSPTIQQFSLDAVKMLASLTTGAAAGAGAGALTFAAVAAFATASTGTAIGTLSGAAATSATLAWLGGGSLAAGGMGVAGGTAVLTGIVALPVILAAGGFLMWKSNKELAKQEQAKLELELAGQSLDRDEAVLDAIALRISHAKKVLKALGAELGSLNHWLTELLRERDDYRTFSEAEKGKLAAQVSLAMAMSAVMAAPLVVERVSLEDSSTSETIANPEFEDTLRSVEDLLAAGTPV